MGNSNYKNKLSTFVFYSENNQNAVGFNLSMGFLLVIKRNQGPDFSTKMGTKTSRYILQLKTVLSQKGRQCHAGHKSTAIDYC